MSGAPRTTRALAPGGRAGSASGVALLAALAVVAALAPGRTSSARAAVAERPAPPCLARVEVRPARAVVGEEVLYRIRILRREGVGELRWEEGLAFPGFRAEWLPGRTAGETTLEGARYGVHLERRALFPVRPGRLAIPPAGLLCETGERGGSDADRARVPGAAVDVREVPAAGRPPGWDGLVGRAELSRSVEPRALALGGTLRISVVLRGEANVWAARSPLAGAFEDADAEVFERPPRLARDAGERLAFRRYWTYDVVPRRAGTLEIPRLRVPYYEPEAGRYAEARAPAARVEVRPGGEDAAAAPDDRHASATAEGAASPAKRTAAPEAEGAEPGAETRGGAEDGPLGGAALAAGALALLALVLGLVAAARRRRSGRAPRRALAEADAAARAGDAEAERAALSRALRLALEPQVERARTRTAEELARALAGHSERDPARRAAALLAALDRARFSGDAAAPDRGAVRGAVAALLRGGRRRDRGRRKAALTRG